MARDLDAAIRARLGEFDASMDATGSLWGVEEMRAALLAVLELHDAVDVEQVEPDGGAVWGNVCVECGTESLGSYPCPTVRAIAEELGVEVDG